MGVWGRSLGAGCSTVWPFHLERPWPPPPLQCFKCGAPRWEGPGWQLEQRLAAALQGSAALPALPLPPRGSDECEAAAALAAQAALQRMRREAAGAAREGAALTGVAPLGSLIPQGPATGSAESSEDEALAATAAAAGFPSFSAGDEFRSLADLTGHLLADSSERAARAPCCRAVGHLCCPWLRQHQHLTGRLLVGCPVQGKRLEAAALMRRLPCTS